MRNGGASSVFRAAWTAIAMAGGTGAAAEPVFVRYGHTVGNGWLYVDPDGFCRLVTPAHVVQPGYPGGGPLVEVLITDLQGRSLEAGRGFVPNTDLDLAFLEVKPFGQQNLCTHSRLGRPNLGVLIDGMSEGELRVMEEGGELREAVDRVSASRVDLASTISVRVRDPAFELLEGYSGGLVMRGADPVGMVTSVHPEMRIAIALRFDAIVAHAASPRRPGASPTAPGDGAIVGVLAAVGGSPEAARRPSASLAAAGWRAEPVEGRVSVEILTDGRALSRLSFTTRGFETGKAIIEYRTRQGENYAYVGHCAIVAGRADCGLGGQLLAVVRLTIPTTRPLTISDLVLR